MPNPASAYIDPATTSYLVQVVSGLVITLSVAFGVFFRRVVAFLVTGWASLGALWSRLAARRGRGAGREGRPPAGRSAAGRLGDGQSLHSASGSKAPSLNAEPGPDLRYARSVAQVESAARRPVVATGDTAGVLRDRIRHGGTATVPAPATVLEGTDGGGAGATEDYASALRSRSARAYARRALVAAPVALAPALLLFLFGPLDIYLRNINEFSFSLGELLRAEAPALAAGSLALATLLVVLRGRAFEVGVSLVLGATLAMWAQGALLNADYGALDGAGVHWEEYTGLAVGDTVAWALIVAAPVVLLFVGRRAWRWAAWLAPTAMVLSWGVATVAVPPSDAAPHRGEEITTYDGLLTVSETANQYILVLDMLDQGLVEEIQAEQPDFFAARLDGFTQFDNNVSDFTRTLPSAVNILTGEDYFFDEPMDQFFARAYREGDFLKELRAAGYSTNIYATNIYSYYDISDIDGLADNVHQVALRTWPPDIVAGMLSLDGFRFAPHVAKPLFLGADTWFVPDSPEPGPDAPFTKDMVAFHQLVQSQAMEPAGPEPRFSYIHLDGAHYPFYLDRELVEVPEGSVSQAEQARGAFKAAFAFIDALKEAGVYEDASIVITGDHGTLKDSPGGRDAGPLTEPRLTGLFVKPAGAAGTPLEHSRAPTKMANVRATLLADAGVEAPGGPPTVFEVPEDSTEPRDVFYREGRSLQRGRIAHWQVTGDARDWSNWHFIEQWDAEYWD
jgi:hypothetical protein